MFLSPKEDFHTKGTFYHITTGTKQFQMSFNTVGNIYLKILISNIVFLMSRNRYFVQKEGLRKEGCFFVKGRFSYERSILSH